MVRAIMIALGLALLLGCQDPGRSAGHAGDVLTIYGDIGTVDRGPSRGTMEPLFFANGIEFTAACVFSTASLNSLRGTTILRALAARRPGHCQSSRDASDPHRARRLSAHH